MEIERRIVTGPFSEVWGGETKRGAEGAPRLIPAENQKG